MITDTKNMRMIDARTPLPDGWWFGISDKSRENRRIASRGREFYFPPAARELSKLAIINKQLCNNVIIQKWFAIDQPIPLGWCLGQLPQKTEAHRKYFDRKT